MRRRAAAGSEAAGAAESESGSMSIDEAGGEAAADVAARGAAAEPAPAAKLLRAARATTDASAASFDFCARLVTPEGFVLARRPRSEAGGSFISAPNLHSAKKKEARRA